MTAVTFENVAKSYGSTKVVQGLNLEIKPQEFVVIIGPSGCGKSTTLRMVAGLESISGGQLKIGGKVVNDLPPIERGVSMVFQSYALYPHMNVFKNMAFGLKLRGLPKDKIKEKIEKTAEALGLTEYLYRKPSQLSGGQRQRVAMGRALVQDPKVFLFDEPLSNLDTQLRHHMRQEIRDLHKKLKSTTLYVTHDQVEAMTLADKIVILRDGFVEQIGSPDELFSKPANKFVAQFIGYPNINLIDGKLVSSGGETSLDLNGVRFKFSKEQLDRLKDVGANEEVSLGIRPTDLHIGSDMKGGEHAIEVDSAHVERVEPLGGKYMVTLAYQNFKLVTEISNGIPPKEGEKVPFYVDVAKTHVFNNQTEKAYF